MQAIEEGHELRPGPARPGAVGLLIRVVLGAASVWGLVELVTSWDIFRDQNLIESDFWFITREELRQALSRRSHGRLELDP